MDGMMMNPKMMGLLGLAQGLLQSSGSSPRQITMGEALGNGLQGGMQGMQQGMDMQIRNQHMQALQSEAQMKQNKLLRDLEARDKLSSIVGGLGSNANPGSISSAIMASGDVDLLPYAAQFRSAMPKVKTTAKVMKDGQAFIQPIYDTGEFGELSGLPAAEKLMQINRGGQVDLANPYSGEAQKSLPISISPGEQARLAQSERHFGASHGLARQNNDLQRQRLMLEMDPEYQAQRAGMIAGAKEQALSKTKTASELPKVVQQGEDTIRLVDDLLTHPGYKMSVGKSAPIGSALSFIPGTNESSFDIALKQLKGKQFLEAFESLKGGGQITQIEGEKATQAMSRMEKANTEGEFEKAAREFQGIIRNGINRTKLRAGQQPQQTQQPNATRADGWGDLR